jgi:hypothetical protein
MPYIRADLSQAHVTSEQGQETVYDPKAADKIISSERITQDLYVTSVALLYDWFVQQSYTGVSQV